MFASRTPLGCILLLCLLTVLSPSQAQEPVAPAPPSAAETPAVAPAPPSAAETPAVTPAPPSAAETPAVTPAPPSAAEAPPVTPGPESPPATGAPTPAEPAAPVVADRTPVVLYVALNGNDAWSGQLPDPNSEGSDGPKATLEGARDAIRELRKVNAGLGPVTVHIRNGIYYLSQAFVLEPQDSGVVAGQITYAAYPGEQPVLSGGRVLTGWKQDGKLWTIAIPEATSTDWRFHSIWVNGVRRTVSHTPNKGYFHTAGKAPPSENPSTGDKIVRSSVAFKYNPDEIKRWENLDEALVVVLHAWETSFHHISALDEENHIVTFRNAAIWPFENWGPLQRYYVLNTMEGLDAPGEWYLNRTTGLLSYMPVDGEDMASAEVVAPSLKQLISLEGNPNAGRYVQNVTFSGLRLFHADFAVGPEGYGDTQGAVGVPGAIQGRGLRFSTIENCEIAHIDTYAIWLRVGSVGNRIVRNHLYDLGAGGIRVGEQQRTSDPLDVKHNTVDNNYIHDGGHVVRSGVGVWIGQSPLNTISHNDICDLSNSAVTIGWAWSNEQGFSYGNLIEQNNIHNIGKGEFSNMAGVYILGGSWNTVVRENLVHDVFAYLYGGWGVHADEGSSNLTIEDNLVYNTTSGGFDQFYGNVNRVRNNIFAFSRESQLSLSNAQTNQPVVFERNIVITDNGIPYGLNWDIANIWQDFNCYFDTGGLDPDFGGGTFIEWQARDRDVHSVVADPLFEDVKAFDFRLKPESPALALGFRPLDPAHAGLYGPADWTALPAKTPHPTIALSEALELKPVSEDFENVAAGEVPSAASVYGVDAKATVKVTEETAAGGQRSLKVTDSEGPQEAWQPELCFIPRFQDGIVVCSFDLRLEPGAAVQHDWRSDWTGRRIGPRIRINEKGEVSVTEDDAVLTTVPPSTWFHVEVACPLGKTATVPATYSMTITVTGQDPQKFDGLACNYRKFRVVEKCWFLSLAKKDTAYYLDNLHFEQRKQ